MHSPSGRTVIVSAGDYEAVVVEVGAGLRSLRKGEDDVVAGYGADEMCNAARGQVLLPWPNRIEDGQYDFEGSSYQLGLSEAAKHNASHGLTRWVNWTLSDQSAESARWTYRLHPQAGYPFLLDLLVDYRVSEAGLTVTIGAHNRGTTPAPYGAGAHPYLTVGRRIDECELVLPAATRSEMSDRGLPSAALPVDGGAFDFRHARLVATTSFDHPFGALIHDGGGARAVLRDPESGREAVMTCDSAYRWLQVYSGDDLPTGSRESLAVEPMTCPPNAFRSGVDRITLEPDQQHLASFTLA